MQQGVIKIGGSGGGWKSRSTGVDGCSNGVTVGEIALVVFYYSTSSEVGRLAAAHIHSTAIFFVASVDRGLDLGIVFGTLCRPGRRKKEKV